MILCNCVSATKKMKEKFKIFEEPVSGTVSHGDSEFKNIFGRKSHVYHHMSNFSKYNDTLICQMTRRSGQLAMALCVHDAFLFCMSIIIMWKLYFFRIFDIRVLIKSIFIVQFAQHIFIANILFDFEWVRVSKQLISLNNGQRLIIIIVMRKFTESIYQYVSQYPPPNYFT